jgi:hypothetical protein
MILPRQGEVSPKATEGRMRRTLDGTPLTSPPSAPYGDCHLPLAGEDRAA